MPDDRHTAEPTEAERHALALAALIDAAGDALERNGPVSPAELRRHQHDRALPPTRTQLGPRPITD